MSIKKINPRIRSFVDQAVPIIKRLLPEYSTDPPLNEPIGKFIGTLDVAVLGNLKLMKLYRGLSADDQIRAAFIARQQLIDQSRG